MAFCTSVRSDSGNKSFLNERVGAKVCVISEWALWKVSPL